MLVILLRTVVHHEVITVKSLFEPPDKLGKTHICREPDITTIDNGQFQKMEGGQVHLKDYFWIKYDSNNE